jgi:hypothetical protein
MKQVQLYSAAALAAVLAVLAPSAFATGYDYSSLTAAVDWTSVGTALLAVGVAIIGIMVVFKGIKLVTRSVKTA